MKWFVFIGVIFMSLNSIAQHVIVKGGSNDYSGKKLSFYIDNDPITHSAEKVGESMVTGKNKFRAKISINQPQQIWFDYGVFRFFFFVEPDKKYQIQLPPFKGKAEHQKRSPFFRPEWVQLKVNNEDSTQLNNQIWNFEREFNRELDKVIRPLVERRSVAHMKQLQQFISSYIKQGGSTYFHFYLHYKLGYVELLRDTRSAKKVLTKYFQSNQLQLNIPVANSLFQTISKNFLIEIPKNISPQLNKLLGQKDLKSVKTIAGSYVGLSDPYTELLLLKNFYNSYYRKDYSPKLMEELIQLQTKSSNSKISKLAQKALEKISYLRPGTEAPSFYLMNQKGERINSQSLYGKFVYLNFMRSDDFASQQYLKILNEYKQKFGKDLEIVSIAVQDTFQKAVDYFKQNNYDWQLLRGATTTKIKDQYKIVTYPTFYLIDPDGVLRLSPAPSPAENFDKQFMQILRQHRIQQVRKRGK
ncbi:TlpA family protein disulfide reductase [Prolixibacteraceae bacterium JC049]|nr:TlpA family protein disulfide reductase [Prolixibacteraceae bacterium JC049]